MADAETLQFEWISRHPVTLDAKFGGFPEEERAKGFGRKRKNIRLKEPPRRFKDAPAEEEIDLHGLTIDQGLFELESYIAMCRQYKVRSLRVIHGMGPEKGPSMRKAVRQFLKTRAKSWINGIQIEGHNPGSVIIFPK